MMKRSTVITGFLFSGVLLLSGCRAFDSAYTAAPEADLAAQTNYAVDKTVCKTPSKVKVAANSTMLMNNSGWADSSDGAVATVSATKKGDFSSTIKIKKVAADKSVSTLSFTVKQTGVNQFSACDFKFTEGDDHTYEYVTGSVMVDQVNTAVDKTNSVLNSGSYDLAFSHSSGATATKVQSVYLGAETPEALGASGSKLIGTYFIDWVADVPAK